MQRVVCCVEVADNIPGLVPGGPAPLFPAGAWAPFVAGLKEGGTTGDSY